MNIDFKKFKVYDTLDKTTPIILDISKELEMCIRDSYYIIH